MENFLEQFKHTFDKSLDVKSPSERYYYQPEVFEPPPPWIDYNPTVYKSPFPNGFKDLRIDPAEVVKVVLENKEQEENSMGAYQNLGRKCDASDCCECPAYFYIHEGGGRQIEENCVSAMRHKEVADAMAKWVNGFGWNAEKLMQTFADTEEDDDDPFA